LLEPLGVEVVGPAATLADAERLVTASQVDVALVDLNLQGELAHGFIDDLNERGIPVVIVTGYDASPRLSAKAVMVLKKPIRAEQLLKTLRAIAGSTTSDRVA